MASLAMAGPTAVNVTSVFVAQRIVISTEKPVEITPIWDNFSGKRTIDLVQQALTTLQMRPHLRNTRMRFHHSMIESKGLSALIRAVSRCCTGRVSSRYHRFGRTIFTSLDSQRQICSPWLKQLLANIAFMVDNDNNLFY
jgi:hypothetical protein